MEAQSIVSKVESNYKDYTDPEDILLLHDYRIREESRVKYTTDDLVRIYFGTGGAAHVKKNRVEYIMREAVHCLKIKIFGNEQLGHQSFVQLKRNMTTI